MMYIKLFEEYIYDKPTYKRGNYYYTEIFNDGIYRYYLTELLNKKVSGIEVELINPKILVGSIIIGFVDDEMRAEYPNDDFYFLIQNNPFVGSITIKEEFRDKGIANKLYNILFDILKNRGYDKVYSDRTRNSKFVDKIWENLCDDKIEIDSEKNIIYVKYL